MAEVYGIGSKGPLVKQMQRALNEKLGYNLVCDGQFGKMSAAALEAFQQKFSIPEEENQYGNVFGLKTQEVLLPYISKRFVQVADLSIAAHMLGVDLPSVQAITATEAKEFGFFNNGFPVILFERHKFYVNLSAAKGASYANSIAASRPDICNPKAGGYLGGTAEIKRLDAASAIHEGAALMSASWGMFQVMGFNHKACGYADVFSFVKAMKESEDLQLEAFVKFIKATPALWAALKARDWATVARLYNGKNYAINQYDKKLADNYKLFLKG